MSAPTFIYGTGPCVWPLLAAIGVTDTATCVGVTLKIDAGEVVTATVRRLVTREQADALVAELATLAAAGKCVKVQESPDGANQ